MDYDLRQSLGRLGSFDKVLDAARDGFYIIRYFY